MKFLYQKRSIFKIKNIQDLYYKIKANLIAKNSKTQVVIVKDEAELSKYFKKNLLSNEIIIGMGAGLISKWITGLQNSI